MAKKYGKAKKATTIAWVLAIAVVLLGGYVFFGSSLSVPGSSGSSGSSGNTALCVGDVTPDLLINAYDADNKGTAITEVGLYRKVGTTTWNAMVTGTEITGLEPNTEYEIILGINTTDQTDNAYGESFTYTTGCQEDETIERAMYNDEIETSLSATFYNNDNNAAAQSFSAGDNYVVSVRLKAGNDEYFGNPNIANPNVVVLKLNQSAWDRPNDVYLADGTELKSVSVPQRYNQQATGYTEYAYALPTVTDKNLEIFFDMKADDTVAPTTDGTAYIYAGGYFINDDANVESGVEDEDATAVATDAPDSVTLDFTA